MQLRNRIEEILKNYRPVMNGEIYLSGEDVCELLHISKRTLQQYRDDNILPYIQIGGKIIYKETDILTVNDLLLGSAYIPKRSIVYIATGDVVEGHKYGSKD